ncbi:MAG: cbb3-type cytochrome c oxidase subunit I, partial [Rhodospirillales bacterium]|nr:cbb3-type cytochrome c oxidase subunit I [Rhodospirillales bacterium]
MFLLTIGSLGLGGLLGAFLAFNAVDTGIYAHGLLLAVFCLGGIVWILRSDGDTGGPADPDSAIPYNDAIVRAGVIASTFWGVVGFLVGLTIALQLTFPVLNFDLPWTSFGRLRPLHTSAVIFAFGGNVLLMSSFHIVQRTCQTRIAGGWAPWFVFWG